MIRRIPTAIAIALLGFVIHAQTMIGESARMTIDATVGDLRVDPTWYTDSEISVRISTGWAFAEHGILTVNGKERKVLESGEEVDFFLPCKANVAEVFVCEWRAGSLVYTRTIRVPGARKTSESGGILLDTRTGMRIVSDGGESLRYDAGWAADGAHVRIEDNGECVTEGVKGSYLWTPLPSCVSRHQLMLTVEDDSGQTVGTETALFDGTIPTLEHSGIVTKPAVEPTSATPGMTEEIRCFRCGELIQAAEAIPALGYIRNVTARQLWPHKKVEVCYEIAEDIGEVADENAALVLTCGEGAVAPELTFTSDSSYPWTTDSGTHKGSGPSHKSGGYNVNNAKSTMCCTVSGATQVSFCWKVSSESSYDKLHFYVDGTEKATAISGNVDWTLVTVALNSSSSHTLKWSYEKDGSQHSGSDCGWVDCIDVKYANTAVAAKTVLGDARCVPGLHRVVWDMEADGAEVKENQAIFCVKVAAVNEEPPPVRSSFYMSAGSNIVFTVSGAGTLTFEARGASDGFFFCIDEGSGNYVRNGVFTEYSRTITGMGDHSIIWGTYADGYGGTHAWGEVKNLCWNGVPIALAQNNPIVLEETIVCGLSRPAHVDTSSSCADGMTVSGTMTLGYSPVDALEVELQVDGTAVLSSAESGEYVWQPQALGTHTLKHIAENRTWTRKVNVTELAFATPPAPNPPTAADANIKITQTSHAFTTAAGTFAIPVQGVGGYTGTYTVSVSDSSWITINSAEANWKAGRPLVYGVTANNGVEERVGYVYVSGHVHTITQAGVGAELGAYAADVGTDGGTVEVTALAAAGVTWHARPNVDWLSVSPTSGTGEGTVTVTVAPWNDVSTRSGTVTIAGKTFTVNQTGRRMRLNKAAADVDWQANVVDVTVTALDDTEWSIGELPSWASVVGTGGATGGGQLALAVNENPSYVARSGVVKVGTETLAISQGGRPTAALSFAITPEETTASVKGANGLVAVTATPDLPWKVTSGSKWLIIAENGDAGTGNGQVSYVASPNLKMKERTGTIVVTPDDESGLQAKTLTVFQPAAEAQVSIDAYVCKSNDEAFDVDVSVDDGVVWEIVNTAPWVSVDGSLERIGSGRVRIMVDVNPTCDFRQTVVAIAGHTIRISQSGGAIEIAPASITITKGGGDGTLVVRAPPNVTWKVAVSDWSWISIWGDDDCSYDDDGDIIDRGDGNVYYYVAECMDSAMPRIGWIRIGDKVVCIVQGAGNQGVPYVAGDASASISGDAETGYVIKPSEGKTAVEVTIPSGIDAGRVTVEVSPKVANVKPNGAKVKIVSGGADITEFLNVPAADGNGVVDLTKATVKEAIVKEAMDIEKGAVIDLCGGSQGAASPTITTAPTRVGLFYQFREGETLDGMKDGDSKVGDGEAWTPNITVKGGNSAFYSIGVGKGE